MDSGAVGRIFDTAEHGITINFLLQEIIYHTFYTKLKTLDW